jgi:hypothetical protein
MKCIHHPNPDVICKSTVCNSSMSYDNVDENGIRKQIKIVIYIKMEWKKKVLLVPFLYFIGKRGNFPEHKNCELAKKLKNNMST